LQRLYSTFPNGWPGTGLVALRVAIGAYMIRSGFETFQSVHFGLGAIQIAAVALGLSLLAGFWTPIAGLMAAFLQIPGLLHGRETAGNLRVLSASLRDVRHVRLLISTSRRSGGC